MPYKIADLAGRYPEGRFILGHAGCDFHFDVLYCLEACANLWAETSKTELGVLEMIARSQGVDRLLFGSDYPFENHQAEIEKVRLLPDVSQQDVQRILGLNALQLLPVGDQKMIVDAHVHLPTDTTGWYAYRKKAGFAEAKPWDAERIVGLMEELGFDRCFLFTLSGLYGFNDWRRANDEIAAAARRFPDRFVGFCTVYPNHDPEGAARELLRSVEQLGLKGLKLHPWLQSFPANTAYLYPCLEVCAKYRIPVLFHTGTPPYSAPFQVMEQARHFPNVPFIMGHFGKLLFLDAVRAPELWPNVYLETSGLARTAEVTFALQRIPAERILFGTDLPLGGLATGKWSLLKWHFLPLTDAERRAILGENALRLISEVRA